MGNDEYRYVIEAYKCRSFSEAARRSNISSQGIGKSIKALEAQLGVKLFQRTPQGIAPTPIADELYSSFCKIIEEEDRIKSLVSSARQSADSQILIGRDSRLGDAVGLGVAKYCEAQGATIKMMLTRDSEEYQAKLFVEKGYDYRFLSLELDSLPALPHAPLCTLHYLPVVNAYSKWAQKETVSLEDFRYCTFLIEDPLYTPVRLLKKMCQERGFEPKFRAVSKTYIWDLLSDPGDYVTFVKNTELEGYPWSSGSYKRLAMTPALDTQIVLQTSHEKLDDELVQCIKEVLATRRFE